MKNTSTSCLSMFWSLFIDIVMIISFVWTVRVLLPIQRTWDEIYCDCDTWWRHQMETFSALLAICAGNSPIPGECPAQRPVTRSFDVCFDLRLNKRFSKQSWGWWFETLFRPLWRHSNVFVKLLCIRSFNFFAEIQLTHLKFDLCGG